MDTLRLSCSSFWVDVRLRQIGRGSSPEDALQELTGNLKGISD